MSANNKKSAAQKRIEAEIEELIVEDDSDISEIEDLVEEYADDYPEDLYDFAFRAAIRLGNMEYVEEHAGDFELNDGDGSSYLYETDDEEMQEVLMNHGAFKSWEDYADCKFAWETVNGTVLAFSEEFQKEVFEKYKEKLNLTDQKIAEILNGEADSTIRADDGDAMDVKEDLSFIGISFENGKEKFEDKCNEPAGDIVDLLELLGYEFDFEGDSWKLETLGVYFIK